jgi:hypothetical protein
MLISLYYPSLTCFNDFFLNTYRLANNFYLIE